MINSIFSYKLQYLELSENECVMLNRIISAKKIMPETL